MHIGGEPVRQLHPKRTRVSIAGGGRHPTRLIFWTRVYRGRKGEKKGFSEQDYAALLDGAHQQLGGPIVLIWDNLHTHLSGVMSRLLDARDWLTIYQPPTYAPELNPVEAVGSHLKRPLANLAKRTVDQPPVTPAFQAL